MTQLATVKPLEKLVAAGSSGGGKTTLITELAPYFPNLTPITFSRPTRAANFMGYDSARLIPPDARPAFQWAALFEQIHAEREAEDFMADRSVVDFLAYYLFEVPYGERDSAYTSVVELYAQRYDAILVVPPNTEQVEDNGVRYLHGIQEVHEILMGLLSDFGLMDRVIPVTANTPAERRDEVFAALQSRFKL